MIPFLCALLMFLPRQFPGTRRTPDAGTVNSSWISGRVHWKSGDPIPLATISIELQEYDDGRNPAWRGELVHVKPNGAFRTSVPSDATFQVCAQVPGEGQKCKMLKVEGADLAIADFEF